MFYAHDSASDVMRVSVTQRRPLARPSVWNKAEVLFCFIPFPAGYCRCPLRPSLSKLIRPFEKHPRTREGRARPESPLVAHTWSEAMWFPLCSQGPYFPPVPAEAIGTDTHVYTHTGQNPIFTFVYCRISSPRDANRGRDAVCLFPVSD